MIIKTNLRRVSGSAPATGSVIYRRPKTRGELCRNIQAGLESEIVSTNVSITVHMLAWLDCWEGQHFTVRPSDNAGWSIFTPNDRAELPGE